MDPERSDPLRPAAEGVRPTLITYLVLLALVLIPAVGLVAPYLTSVASGMILAVLFQPVYAKLRRRLSPVLAGVSVTLGAVLLVLVPLTLVVIGGIRQATALVLNLRGTEAPTAHELVEVIRRWIPASDRLGSPEELSAMLTSGLVTALESVSGFLFAQAQQLPAMVLQVVIVVLSTYVMLVDGRALFRWIMEKVPISRQIATALVVSFRRSTKAVVLASVAAAGAQAVCILAAFALLGVPAALLAASAAFVLAWIPTFGPFPVWASAAVWLVVQGSPTRALLMVGAGVVIGLVDNVVRSLVLRGQKAMHPLVSLLSILGGLTVFGIPGAFLGPLLASLAISVLDIWPAVASYCGIAVSGSGEEVPEVPL